MREPRLILMEAITRQRTVAATYNGKRIHLAPHLLFERGDALFLTAFNLDKIWRSYETPRLGMFKLDGLSEFELREDGFEPLATFTPALPRDDDTLILAV